jgi:hypothetical protein
METLDKVLWTSVLLLAFFLIAFLIYYLRLRHIKNRYKLFEDPPHG